MQKGTTDDPSPLNRMSTKKDKLPDFTPVQTDNKVIFRPPDGHNSRVQAVRILLPHGRDQFSIFGNSIRGALPRTIKEVLGSPAGGQAELLIYSSEIGLEYILHVSPDTLDGRSFNQTTIDSFVDGVMSPAINKTVEAAERFFPEDIGIEVGTLNLDPVGMSAVSTCRLVLEKNQAVTAIGKQRYSPLQQMLELLKEANEPFLYQVLIDASNRTYNVSIRLANYNPKHTVTGRKGLAKVASQGHRRDIGMIFKPFNLHSNYQLPIDKYWKTSYPEKIGGSVGYDAVYSYHSQNAWRSRVEIRREAETLKDLVVGKIEHRALLNGNASYDMLYSDLDRFPRFQIAPAQLPLFTEFVPLNFDQNPWDLVQGRSAPTFSTEYIVSEVDPTIQGVGIGKKNAPGYSSTSVQNEGGITHGTVGKATTRWFTEQGDDIQKIEQEGDSVSDQELYPQDGMVVALDLEVDCDIVPVEIESSNSEKAANTLVNAARAYCNDQHAIFVYPNRSLAKRGLGHLSEPFRWTTDGETRLYNGTEPIRHTDGEILVCEGSVNSEWYISPDGELRLEVDGEERTCGNAGADVETFEYDCHYFSKKKDTRIVYTQRGETVAEYTTKAEFESEWTQLYRPHVPVDISYLHRVTVMYRDKDDGELYILEPNPDWDVSDDIGARKRYSGFVEQFVDTYTVEFEGGEILKPDFRERALTWYRACSMNKVPPESEFGRATPDYVEMKSRQNNRLDVLDNRTWIYPLGIVSPHLPGVEKDLDLRE